MTKRAAKDSICAVDFAFRRLGGKYKGRVLWYIHQHRIMRYGNLLRVIADITPKMLAQTLNELEKDELIHREAYQELPPRVEYTLTAVGLELIPIINQLREWGDKRLMAGAAQGATIIDCIPTPHPAAGC
jgi:DNA-binding HxlR family transcriptional regulator